MVLNIVKMDHVSFYPTLWRVGLLLCVLFAQPVLTLRCYVCDSMENPNCGDHFRVLPSDASNCPAGSRCIKFRGFRGSGVVKSPEVHRSCSLTFESNGCQFSNRNGIDGEVCACTTNLCNPASAVRGSVSMMMLLCMTWGSWFYTCMS